VLCLPRNIISTLGINIRRHSESKRPDLAKLDVSKRQIKTTDLLKHPNGERRFFEKINAVNEAVTKVVFEVARKQIDGAGKSLTDGEFVKSCVF
jgi:hypothetical protein